MYYSNKMLLKFLIKEMQHLVKELDRLKQTFHLYKLYTAIWDSKELRIWGWSWPVWRYTPAISGSNVANHEYTQGTHIWDQGSKKISRNSGATSNFCAPKLWCEAIPITKEKKIWGTSVKNLVTWVMWHPGFVHSCFKCSSN